jgi:hypothetical protein
MDIQKLNIDYGDIVILTYSDQMDIDAINTHYNTVKEVIKSKGGIVIANREDLLIGIQIIKEEEGYPFQ